MVNWEEVDLNDCTDCESNDWSLSFEDEKDDPSEVEYAVFECGGCTREGRVYVDGGNIQQTGGLRA